MSLEFSRLMQVPVASRDVTWELDFLRELPKTSVRVIEETPVEGPDGWPYLLLETGGNDPIPEVAQWLAARGVGFVLNPEKSIPDFVVSYGMVWNFCQRGEFLTPTSTRAQAALVITDGQQLFTGVPSLAYLPEEPRGLLREFFKRQKAAAPKVLMVSIDQLNWDLAFSVESIGSPPAKEHAGIAEAISWFLPAHYSVALVSEKTIPGFTAL
jgi:hypothetical protein